MPGKMFRVTRDAVRKKIAEVEGSLQTSKDDLKGLDSLRDGDMMDDPLMHALLEKQEMQSRELIRLRGYVSDDLEIIELSEVGEGIGVTLGHQVKLKVSYADGFVDEFTATIGSTIDKQYLQQLPLYNQYFDGTSRILISDDTPIARAIMGRSVGENIKFELDGQTNEIKILSIESSPLFTES